MNSKGSVIQFHFIRKLPTEFCLHSAQQLESSLLHILSMNLSPTFPFHVALPYISFPCSFFLPSFPCSFFLHIISMFLSLTFLSIPFSFLPFHSSLLHILSTFLLLRYPFHVPLSYHLPFYSSLLLSFPCSYLLHIHQMFLFPTYLPFHVNLSYISFPFSSLLPTFHVPLSYISFPCSSLLPFHVPLSYISFTCFSLLTSFSCSSILYSYHRS